MSSQGWYDQHGVFHEGPPPTPQAPAAPTTPVEPAPAPTGWYDQHGTYHEGTPPGLLTPQEPAAPVAPAYAPAAPAAKHTGLVALLITLCVLLALTLGAIVWALVTGFSLANANTAVEEEAPAAAATQTVDVALAPAAAIGAHAFTPTPWVTTPASSLALDASGSASPTDDPAPVTAMPGDTDSLFTFPIGASYAAGDAPSLLAGLNADPARAEAFVTALSSDPALGWGQPLTVADLEGYLRQLSYVALSSDTWVTHHAFVDGAAQPTQAVLQKGSGVLVDRHGVPRVRTISGDPLTQADYADGAGVSATVGESWPDFDPAEVVVIQPASAVLDAYQVASDSGPADMAATPCRGAGLGAACDPPGPAAVIVPAPDAPANLVAPQATNCTPTQATGAAVDFRFLNNSGETLYDYYYDPTNCVMLGPPLEGLPDGYSAGWSLAKQGIDPVYIVFANAAGEITSEFMLEAGAVVVR